MTPIEREEKRMREVTQNKARSARVYQARGNQRGWQFKSIGGAPACVKRRISDV